MAFIVEDGSGMAQANTYASVAFITNYLTERNRHESSGWSDLDLVVQQGAAIAATDYLENRFRNLFKGRKEFWSLKLAKGVLTVPTNPVGSSTVVLGSVTYTFVATLTLADQVLIGADASESIDNLIAAINQGEGEGTKYGTGTIANPDISARVFEDDTMIAEALVEGAAGNLLASTTNIPSATWTSATLQGGTDTGRPQPLSFPRLSLFDRDGIPVVGMPDRLLFATAEYAVRASTAELNPDLTTDATGFQVIKKREKVGPIEEETQYHPGGGPKITQTYPAADALLNEYLRPVGTVVRL
jgi:hypothetical protein